MKIKKRPSQKGLLIAGILLLALSISVFFSQQKQQTKQHAQTAIWQPVPNTTWQWQLTGDIDTSVDAAVYDIDWEADASVVQTLHSQGKKVICYLSVGSIEDWRSDAGSFPAEIIGADYEGWPGEKWLDIRNIEKLGPIMSARFDVCKQKGFDAIEPDNMDVPDGNGSGFDLTDADELTYANWLADEAHKRGMSIGIKNTGKQAQALVSNFDFAVVEECFQFNECDTYLPFIQANKAVFEAEYETSTSEFCPQAKEMKISAIKKNLNLDAPREACELDQPISQPTTINPTTSAPIVPSVVCLGSCDVLTPTPPTTSPNITTPPTPATAPSSNPCIASNNPQTAEYQISRHNNDGGNRFDFFQFIIQLIGLLLQFLFGQNPIAIPSTPLPNPTTPQPIDQPDMPISPTPCN